MNEGHKATARAHTGRLVYQPRALFLQRRQGRADIRHVERDVMNPLPSLFKEFRNGRVGRCGLEQFHPRSTHRKHANAHLLLGNFLNLVRLEPESFAPKTD
jgi:hypothetical protein